MKQLLVENDFIREELKNMDNNTSKDSSNIFNDGHKEIYI